jgi:shikimate dehydrogenase
MRLAARASAVVLAGEAEASGFELIINATPAGMRPTDPLPIDAAGLDPSATVADFVTGPAMTPLLDAAKKKGCKVVTGDDMFAVQAVVMADILLAA